MGDGEAARERREGPGYASRFVGGEPGARATRHELGMFRNDGPLKPPTLEDLSDEDIHRMLAERSAQREPNGCRETREYTMAPFKAPGHRPIMAPSPATPAA